MAQDTSDWTQPIPLGLLTPDYKVVSPEMAVDEFGSVHVVAPRNSYEGENSPFNQTIFYTRWNGSKWSEPNDILAAWDGEQVTVEKLVATYPDALHMLWWTLNGHLYWSRAASLEAASAHAWKTIDLVPGASSADLVLSGEGDAAIIYVQDNNEVVFQRTFDGGSTWPVWSEIWAPPTDKQATRLVRLASNETGVYHATWTETDGSLNWNPSGIWYARSTDGGDTWTDFKNIRDQGSYANIGFDSVGNVHLLWNHNVSTVDGRYHAWSQDGGKRWSEPEWIFPGLSGRTGYPRMILDSDGVLHQVTSGYGRGGSDNIYYSRWLGDHWSEASLISIGIERSEGPAVAIVRGNQLFAAWRSWDLNDIVYATYKTGATQLPLSLELASSTRVSSTDESGTPISALKDENKVTVTLAPALLAQAEDNFQNSPLLPVAWGILPVLIFIVGMVILQSRRIRM